MFTCVVSYVVPTLIKQKKVVEIRPDSGKNYLHKIADIGTTTRQEYGKKIWEFANSKPVKSKFSNVCQKSQHCYSNTNWSVLSYFVNRPLYRPLCMTSWCYPQRRSMLFSARVASEIYLKFRKKKKTNKTTKKNHLTTYSVPVIEEVVLLCFFLLLFCSIIITSCVILDSLTYEKNSGNLDY